MKAAAGKVLGMPMSKVFAYSGSLWAESDLTGLAGKLGKTAGVDVFQLAMADRSAEVTSSDIVWAGGNVDVAEGQVRLSVAAHNPEQALAFLRKRLGLEAVLEAGIVSIEETPEGSLAASVVEPVPSDSPYPLTEEGLSGAVTFVLYGDQAQGDEKVETAQWLESLDREALPIFERVLETFNVEGELRAAEYVEYLIEGLPPEKATAK